MSKSENTHQVTFHTQTAILTDYAQQSSPRSDAAALAVTLDVLRQKKDLRREFFRARPHVAWLDVLWEEGFYKVIPAIETLEDNSGWFRFWDLQEFLIYHAVKRPNYVLEHLNFLNSEKADVRFLQAGLRALTNLVVTDPDHIEPVLFLVRSWIEDIALSASLVYEAFELVEALVGHSHAAAFELLKALAKPHPNGNARAISGSGEGEYVLNADALSVLDTTSRLRLDNKEERPLFSLLRQCDFEALREVWEARLLETLDVEAETQGFSGKAPDHTWWRRAIEESDQDNGFSHKDFLLELLRDTLQDQGKDNIEDVRGHIERYLAHPRQILRRLGIHLLSFFPGELIPFVTEILLDADNYHDSDIHHEFFNVLAEGFPLMSEVDQRTALDIILRGPSEEYLESSVEWGLSIKGGDAAEFRQLYLDLWRRDRLWMIRAHLPNAEKTLLDDIVARFKKPEHPSFNNYMMGGFVSNSSPLSREELSRYTPSQLWDFLSTWESPTLQGGGLVEVNWDGLASDIAYVLRQNLLYYDRWIVPLFKLRPALALAMINVTFSLEESELPKQSSHKGTQGSIRNPRRGRTRRVYSSSDSVETEAVSSQENNSGISSGEIFTIDVENTLPEEDAIVVNVEPNSTFDAMLLVPMSDDEMWEWRLQLAESILADQKLSVDMTRNIHGGWSDVRRSLVSMISNGLAQKDQRKIPDSLLPRVRDSLMLFAEDPDPDAMSDRPQEGWLGHQDPLIVAINHVRTEALSALEVYSSTLWERGLDGHPRIGAGLRRIEPQVLATLTTHLNLNYDPSHAVRSVYGRHLVSFYWLHQEWTEAHLYDIFPLGTDKESRWYFAAAWDSYIVSNPQLYLPLFDKMRPIYVQAIEAMELGFLTKTYLRRTESFAVHLFAEYFNDEELGLKYDLRSEAGPNNLLRLFMEKATPEQRGKVAWTLWRTMTEEKKRAANQENSEDGIIRPPLALLWQKVREFWQWRADESSQKSHPADFDEEMQWLCLLVNAAPEEESLASLSSLLLDTIPHLEGQKGIRHAWEELEGFIAKHVQQDPTIAIRVYSRMRAHVTRPSYLSEDNARFILETAAKNRDSRQDTLELLDLLARQGNSNFDDVYDHYRNAPL